MMQQPAQPIGLDGRGVALDSGAVIGGRYRIEQHLGDGTIGMVYRAADLKSRTPVALRILPAGLFEDEDDLEDLRAGVRSASRVSHRNVVETHGFGRDESGALFLATELVLGLSLSELMATKADRGKALSPRVAYEVLSQVVDGLTAAEGQSHGALSSSSVFATRSRVMKVADLDAGRVWPRLSSYVQGGARPFFAPEVIAGGDPSPRSEVYSLGAMLHHLLEGAPPRPGELPAPSVTRPYLSADFDGLIQRATSAEPAERFANPKELRSSLRGLVEIHGSPHVPGGDASPFDDDLTAGMTQERKMPNPDDPFAPSGAEAQPAPQSEPSPAAPSPQPPPAAAPSPILSGPAPEDDGRISFGDLLGGAPSSGRPSAEAIDLGSLVTGSSDQMDDQVWMVQQNNLDHGPFSARELGQQVIAGKIAGDDMVLNMDTGVRQRCEVWPEFTSVVKNSRERRQKEEEAAAMRKVETVEKGVGYLRYLVAVGIIVLIGIGVGSYFLILRATRGSGPQNAEDFADLVATGEIPVRTGAGIMEDERSKRQGGRRGGRGGGGGGGGGGRGGMSAEEAMSRGVDYGDLSGGMTQLSVGQINSVMNRHARRFYPCLYGHSGRVTLDFVINGDGSVAGVSVPGASGSMRSCMAGRMRGIRFPSFGSPRMRASFYFEVGN